MSIQICYDAYFPQMTVLPVIKGARVVFDLSSERGYADDAYWTAVSPALYQGRAQAAGAAIVQANTGACISFFFTPTCLRSHPHCCV